MLLRLHKDKGVLTSDTFSALRTLCAPSLTAAALSGLQTSPLPYSYAIHLRTLLMLHLVLLPLAMVHDKSSPVQVMSASIVVGYCLLGLEDLGASIDDPFSDRVSGIPLEQETASVASEIAMLCE